MGWSAATRRSRTLAGAVTTRPGPEPSDRRAQVQADLVEYLVITFPDSSALGSVVPALTDIVRAEQVRVLDIAVLVRASDGALEVREVTDIEDLAALAEFAPELGLLSEGDLRLAARVVRPEEAAIVLVAEDRWAERLSAAVREAGGQIAGGERVSPVRVEVALTDRDDERGG